MKGKLSQLNDAHTEREQETRDYIARFKNLFYSKLDTRNSQEGRNFQSGSPLNRRYNKIVVNHFKDLIQARVARLTRFKPAVTVIPPSNEHEDKVAAKVAKDLLDYRWYQIDMEELQKSAALNADLAGQHFVTIDWDPDTGPIHPDATDAEGEPLLDEDGNVVVGDTGEPKLIEGDVRIGDVVYNEYLNEDVFLEDKKANIDDIDWYFCRELHDAEALKKDHDGKIGIIDKSKGAKHFNHDSMMEETAHDKVMVHWFRHRPTKYFPQGCEIKFIREGILQKEPYPYHTPDMSLPGFLNIERLTSEDVPGELPGMPVSRHIKALQDQYNNLTTMVIRNQQLASHPKWMMPAGAASLKSLGNDLTVVQFKGPVPPQLVQSNPTPGEIFKFRDSLKEEMSQIAKIHGVSRGEPPAGIKAGVALQFLNEQEQEQFSAQISKFQTFKRNLARKTIKIMGIFYENDDGRKVRIIGRGTGHDLDVIDFDVSIFKKDFDIRVQDSTTLPQSRAARTQTIIDLHEAFDSPENPLFQREQILEMIDVAQSDKFVDQATVNVNSAQSENLRIMNLGKATPPRRWEDHIIHYKIHLLQMQDKAFEDAPKSNKQLMKDHILAHEVFLYSQSVKNPLVKERILRELPTFPLYLKTDEIEKLLSEEAQLANISAPVPQGAVPGAEINVPPPGAAPEQQQTEPLPQGEDAQAEPITPTPNPLPGV